MSLKKVLLTLPTFSRFFQNGVISICAIFDLAEVNRILHCGFLFSFVFPFQPYFSQKVVLESACCCSQSCFSKGCSSFPTNKVILESVFFRQIQELGFGQQQLLENQPRNDFSHLVKDQFGKEYCLEKILQWAFKKICLQRSA